MGKHDIDWAKTAKEWADEVAVLEKSGDKDSREYRRAVQNLRSAERHLEVQQEKQAERDRYAAMTPREVARAVVDRLTEPF